MGDKWTFDTADDVDAVTHKLRQNKAAWARVAALGVEDFGPQFQIWYVESDNSKGWILTPVDSDSSDPDAASAVTEVLNDSETAAVTYSAREESYYVWWTPLHS